MQGALRDYIVATAKVAVTQSKMKTAYDSIANRQRIAGN